MAFTQFADVTIPPGDALGLGGVILPTETVIVGIIGTQRRGGMPLAYCRVIVVGDGGPIGPLPGVAESFLLNNQNVFIPPKAYTSPFNGWFLTAYTIDKSNAEPLRILAFKQ